MAGWGLMMGVGQGIQDAGKMYMDVKKEEMLQKAEQRKEERAEQRRIAQEQREAVRLQTTPDPKQTKYVEKDGLFWEQTRSGTGAVLEEKLASKSDIDAINLEKRKAEASIQADLAMGDYRAAQMKSAVANAEQTSAETAFLPVKQQLEAERTIAQTGQANRANQPKPPASTKATLPDVANALVEQNPMLKATYTEGAEPSMTQTELKGVVTDVVKEWKARGIQSVPTQKDLDLAVSEYLKNRPKKKGKTESVVIPRGLK